MTLFEGNISAHYPGSEICYVIGPSNTERVWPFAQIMKLDFSILGEQTVESLTYRAEHRY